VFSIAHIHDNGEFFASDFRLQVDVSKRATSTIEGFVPGPGLSFSHELSRFDGRVLPPKVEFKAMHQWNRITFRFDSLCINSELLPIKKVDCEHCNCPESYLRPIPISSLAFLVPNFMCICCGRKYVCSCSKEYLDILGKRESYDNSNIQMLANEAVFRSATCHICRNKPSEIKFTTSQNSSVIAQHYYPYILQEASLQGVDIRAGENLVREKLGIPRIGEGWVNEMLLVNTIKHLFPEYTVEHQASPAWLGRQRYDAFIPELRIAIEYNGEQHAYPIERFGGELGLVATQARDKRKRELSNQNGVELVVFWFDEELSEEDTRGRIQEAIDKAVGSE
jgi:hypothetical protein